MLTCLFHLIFLPGSNNSGSIERFYIICKHLALQYCSSVCRQSFLLYTYNIFIDYKLKETRFSLYGLGGLPSLLPINSSDIIAHIKDLYYLSDYMVIRAPLGGAF